MFKRLILLLCCLLPLLLSCSGHGGEGSLDTGLLKSVPSDAVLVARFSRADEGLASLLDSSNVFRRLDLGRLSSEEMAFSCNYAAGVVSLLAVDASCFAADSLSDSVLRNAESLGLKTTRTWVSGRRTILFGSSQAILSQALSHISEDTSILEAPYFGDVLAACGRNAVILRNSGAARLLPRNTAFQKYESRKSVGRFLKDYAEWMVFNLRQDGSFVMTPVCGDNPVYYSNTLSGLPCSESRISEVLPASTEWAVGLSLKDWHVYRDAYLSFLDAHNAVTSSTNAGKSAARTGVRELAKVVFDGREILLLRPSSMPSELESWHPSKLFGDAFSIKDVSCAVACDGWVVYGSRKDVDAYVQSARGVPPHWPAASCSAYAYCRAGFSAAVRGDAVDFERVLN